MASWVKKLGQGRGLELHYELCISESCIKIKINLIFTLWGATKSFMKAFRAVIKSFETLQRNLELIISVNFLSPSWIETGRVNITLLNSFCLVLETKHGVLDLKGATYDLRRTTYDFWSDLRLMPSLSFCICLFLQ